MAKAPRRPEEIFEEFTKDYKEAFGEDLLSISLYGSGARGEYIPGRSDLNFLILLREEGIKRLEGATRLVAKWRRRAVAIPLFLTPWYIKTSLDSFPLEFLDMKCHHITIYGDDPFKDIEIEKKALRLQCEREIKGKLLLLREAAVGSEGKKEPLIAVFSQSITALSAIFSGLLYLMDVEAPISRKEAAVALCKKVGLREEVFEGVWRIKRGEWKPSQKEAVELMASYLEEVRRLALWVDEFAKEVG